MARFSTTEWLIFSLVWLIASFGSAALLAHLYRKLHPELDFYKLWALWTVIVSLLAGAIFALDLL